MKMQNVKDDQTGLIHPENWRLQFFIIGGGQGRNPGCSLSPQNILKEADINFFFNVLAKFGDYKDNKDIKKMV